MTESSARFVPFTRKQMLGCAALAILAAALGAQSTVTPAQTPSKWNRPKAPVDAAAGHAQLLGKAQADLAFGLIKTIAAKDEQANAVASPASAAGALAVVAYGTDEKTGRDPLLASIYRVLSFPGNASQNMLKILRAASSRPKDGGPLTIANALYIDKKGKPNETTLDRVRQGGAKVELVSFDDDEAKTKANSWVAEQTQNKIPIILNTVDRDAQLIALNALYFKDKWKQPFDSKRTRPSKFQRINKEPVDTQLMSSAIDYYRFQEDGKFTAIDLPFATDGYALTLVTTKGAPALAKDFEGAKGWLAGQGFKDEKGQVSFPRLTISTDLDIKPVFDKLGLKDEALKSFTKTELRLTQARQRVEFKVDEEGAEAAAATAITASRSLQNDYKAFVADKPFIFALRDNKTGLILVAGYIAEPGSS